MNIKDEDLLKLTKIASQQIENFTCAVCCKYYIAPETAPCGHTLCHSCWRGRLSCASCAKPINHRSLKHNSPLHNLTEHVHTLIDAFEKLFSVKVAEFLMAAESENDSTKHVRDWLASSQNHFSAPAESSERSSREMAHSGPLNVSSNKIQIHNTSKPKSSERVVYVPNVPQEDWDRIEPMPDTEDIRKDKENVVGPMDIEPYYVDDENEYTIAKPRRSSRRSEVKLNENKKINEKTSLEDQNAKDSSEEIDKKSNKSKQNWLNVKRMRKEFSKLNKKNRSKLNVSIQMCKKTKNATNTVDGLPQAATMHYDIDDNTPNNLQDKETSDQNINSDENKITKTNSLSDSNTSTIANNKNPNAIITTTSNQGLTHYQNNLKAKNVETHENNKEIIHSLDHETTESRIYPTNTVKSPFYRMSSLHPKSIEENAKESSKTVKTTNYNVVDSNTSHINKLNDDIEITIKVGNTIANIVIKRKNDMQLKINTDREIQTSLDPQEVNEKLNFVPDTPGQNIVINVSGNNEVQVTSQVVANPRVEELKRDSTSGGTGPEKKNTDSADTGTAQYEITDSVKKELSKVMDFEYVGDKQIPSKSTVTGNIELSKDTQKSAAGPGDLEHLNDLDIFDSESVKESDVQMLKNTEHASSEIMLCTVKTRNKIKKITDKRHKDSSDEDWPESKKAKLNEDIAKSKENQLESDSMNCDVIMGTVFANMDAEMETHRGQNEITSDDNTRETQPDKCAATRNPSQIISNQCNNQKDSENVFSIDITKENGNVEIAPLASANITMPIATPPSNVEDFLTPVMSRAADLGAQGMNDDSDKSVVEETPEKTSFTKVKQRSSGANIDGNRSRRIDVSDSKPSKKNSSAIVELSDSSATDRGFGADDARDERPTDTPLTINKFVDRIQHNSTPLAKKSLEFDREAADDATLCPTAEAAKTTQERQFLLEAFEETPAGSPRACVVAGSALSAAQSAGVRRLCARRGWRLAARPAHALTHLVVGVDRDNRAQRTVKYMCALASSAWIVSYAWVERSLRAGAPLDEEPFEVLDSTGLPGPRRARLAADKLFRGMTFYCMEPFSVFDVDTFKGMLESAGGRVESSAAAVRASGRAPALLLAEPEHTQEDRFVYLALELGVVPVNYEWALNCLGAYTLQSVRGLLLCPDALLPAAARTWPPALLAADELDE